MATQRKTSNSSAVVEPQDHKEKKVSLSQVDGYKLIVPVKNLSASDALDIMSVMSVEDESTRSYMTAVSECIRFISDNLVVDKDGWEKFNTASNANAVIKLVTAYVEQVGLGLS